MLTSYIKPIQLRSICKRKRCEILPTDDLQSNDENLHTLEEKKFESQVSEDLHDVTNANMNETTECLNENVDSQKPEIQTRSFDTIWDTNKLMPKIDDNGEIKIADLYSNSANGYNRASCMGATISRSMKEERRSLDIIELLDTIRPHMLTSEESNRVSNNCINPNNANSNTNNTSLPED